MSSSSYGTWIMRLQGNEKIIEPVILERRCVQLIHAKIIWTGMHSNEG